VRISTWPPRAITFDDVDITSLALRDMVAMGHSVEQSAAPQTSARSRSTREKISAQPGIGRLWQQERYHDAIINNRFFVHNVVNNTILTC
jgi:hypothetical protein